MHVTSSHTLHTQIGRSSLTLQSSLRLQWTLSLAQPPQLPRVDAGGRGQSCSEHGSGTHVKQRLSVPLNGEGFFYTSYKTSARFSARLLVCVEEPFTAQWDTCPVTLLSCAEDKQTAAQYNGLADGTTMIAGDATTQCRRLHLCLRHLATEGPPSLM